MNYYRFESAFLAPKNYRNMQINTSKLLYNVTKIVRTAQKQYFKQRNPENLDYSKTAEATLDMVLTMDYNFQTQRQKTFYNNVHQMRQYQVKYFSTLNEDALRTARQYESYVDNEIERVEKLLHPKPEQKKLEL